MRINPPYHLGSFSSEARGSGSTLSHRRSLTFPHPAPSTYAGKALLSSPILCAPSTVLADSYFSGFASKFTVGQQRPISYSRAHALKWREEEEWDMTINTPGPDRS